MDVPRVVSHESGTFLVLIDTDFGTNVDDLLAVLFAVGSEEVDLVAVTTVHGLPEVRAQAVKHVLDLVGASSIPVGAGRLPVTGELFVSGEEGTYAPIEAPSAQFPSASEVFHQTLREHGGDLVVAAIGPLTNVAEWLSAPLETRPRCVLAMAGCFREGGTDRNVKSDATAAQRLAEAGIPVLFVGIEVCRQVIYGPEDLAELVKQNADSEIAQLVEVQSKKWWSFKNAEFSNPCDPLTLLAMTKPSLLKFQRSDVSFVVGGLRDGETEWRDHDSGEFDRVLSVDVEATRREIVSTIGNAMRGAR